MTTATVGTTQGIQSFSRNQPGPVPVHQPLPSRKEPLVQVCCISASRASNVPTVMEQFPDCYWYVPDNQCELYISHGAPGPFVCGVAGRLPMKAKQANQALEEMFEAGFDVVATVDDDIVRVLSATTRETIPPMQAVRAIALVLWEHPTARLAGPYSGTNTSWAGGVVKYTGNVPGAMQLHRRGATVSELHQRGATVSELNKRVAKGGKPYLAYDETLAQLEDLDMCIQHHLNNGGVLLHGGYCLENLWAGNPGGYQEVRTTKHVQRNVHEMAAKWGSYGCKFELDPTHRNGMRFRIPWRKLASWYEA